MSQRSVCVFREIMLVAAHRRTMDPRRRFPVPRPTDDPSVPRRRALLRIGGAVATGLLAGCLGGVRPPAIRTDGGSGDGGPGDGDGGSGGDDGAPDPGNDTDGAGGTRPRGTGGPGVSIVAVDDAPDLPVRPGVSVAREAATESHPPQLRVTLTNESDEPVSVGEGRAVVFAYVADDSRALILLPAGGDYPADPGCWRLAEPIAVTEEYRIRTLDPGETVSTRVDLYATPGEDACLPVGRFRFETTYSVAPGRDALPDGENGQRGRWGFFVTLE